MAIYLWDEIGTKERGFFETASRGDAKRPGRLDDDLGEALFRMFGGLGD